MSPLSSTVTNCLLRAEAKALATTGPEGLNVVPVSTIKVVDGDIILVDYFFSKTRANLQQGEGAALTAWSGFKGYQVKGKVEYLTQGLLFEGLVAWIAQLHPERTVCGVVRLTPTAVYDIGIG